jgi:hypothetical protein
LHEKILQQWEVKSREQHVIYMCVCVCLYAHIIIMFVVGVFLHVASISRAGGKENGVELFSFFLRFFFGNCRLF